MTWPVVLRTEAYDDLQLAYDWYECKQVGLGDRFKEDVGELKDRIGGNPFFYAEISHGVRGGKLRKFPYVVYYLLETDQVIIIAILHGRRSPRVWKRRVV